ncbi:FtsX-like permease family protein [uncultured Bacteroides sp.]|uniref:ABC transporter permease n=1 Tax=uncultured Bacteroides sp. TaxID=162156 RepID=UPI002596E585|nr:FtsX-like permease family protein [uncultured Bacteroides sp.]
MMIKQIFKMIWNQRRLNGWIWMELLVVFVALWYLVDMFVVQLYSYTRPMGYDITNCWKLSFDVYPEDADEYVNDTTRTQTEGEALAKILERLRRAPEVDNACVAFYSSPYSGGNSWTQIMPCTADSSKFKEQSYHQYIVSAEFYDVFRIKSREGKPLSELLTQKQLSYFITPALEKDFFGSQSAVGQKVRYPGSTREIHIAAVTAPVRITEFVKPEPELFFTMWPKELERQVNATGASNMEVTVRMKEELTSEQMGHFLNRMKNQLTENNLYIIGMEDMKQQRSDRLQYEWRKISINLLLSVFILLNVLFGITGTFWLSIEQRRCETGLRMALGSTRRRVGWFFTAEGWLLLTTVVPLVLVVIFNMVHMEIPDLYNLSFTWWRFAVSFGGVLLLMGLIIALGTWLPARRAMKLQPAEALHYE